MFTRLILLIVSLILWAIPAPAAQGDPPDPRATFQRIIDDYGRQWEMADGRIDLRRLDRFYAAGDNVTIIDFAPPGISRSWAAHRDALAKQLFAKLRVNRFVPRQDATVRMIGPDVAVTTFTFDYANEGKDGSRFALVGRQTNVWQRAGGIWQIVHEHGSPVPSFQDGP